MQDAVRLQVNLCVMVTDTMLPVKYIRVRVQIEGPTTCSRVIRVIRSEKAQLQAEDFNSWDAGTGIIMPACLYDQSQQNKEFNDKVAYVRLGG
jgi:hypothetical protein